MNIVPFIASFALVAGLSMCSTDKPTTELKNLDAQLKRSSCVLKFETESYNLPLAEFKKRIRDKYHLKKNQFITNAQINQYLDELDVEKCGPKL